MHRNVSRGRKAVVCERVEAHLLRQTRTSSAGGGLSWGVALRQSRRPIGGVRLPSPSLCCAALSAAPTSVRLAGAGEKATQTEYSTPDPEQEPARGFGGDKPRLWIAKRKFSPVGAGFARVCWGSGVYDTRNVDTKSLDANGGM